MSKSEEPIHQRLIELIEKLEGGVQRRFARQVGIGAGVIGDILGQRKSKPGFELVSKILQTYPQLRAEWLMRGEGEMLKPAPGEDAGIKNPVVSDSPFDIDKPVHYEHKKPVTHQGESVPTFRVKGTKPPEPVGTDLVRQVDKHTREIELMQQTLETVVAELRQLHAK